MRKIYPLFIILLAIFLVSCKSEATPSPTPEPTSAPTSTPRPTPRPTPSPTPAPTGPINSERAVEDDCYVFENANIVDSFDYGFQYGIPWGYFDDYTLVYFTKDSFEYMALTPNAEGKVYMNTISQEIPRLTSKSGQLYTPLLQLELKFSTPEDRARYEKVLNSKQSEGDKYLAKRAWQAKCKRVYSIYLFSEAMWNQWLKEGQPHSSLTGCENTSVLGTKNEIVYVLAVDESSSEGLSEEDTALYNEMLEWLPTMIEKVKIIE